MTGSVLKRGDKWYVKYELPREADGKRRMKMQVAGRTKREAEAALTRILSEIQRGAYSEPSRETVAHFLEGWLSSCAKQRVGARTLHRYDELIRLHIIPTLGGRPLQALRAPHLQELYGKLLEHGRADGKGGLSPQTVLHVHRLLHEALEQAVKWSLVARNPSDDVDAPKVRRAEMKTWNPEQIKAALEAAEGQWIYMPLMLALGTGMRAGELMGVQWQDIDLQRGTLICRRSAAVANNRRDTPIQFKQPKSGKGRSVSLPVPVVEALQRHRERQAEERALFGRSLGPEDLVICHADGLPMRPDTLTNRFSTFLTSANLPRIRFHDLRHSHATLLLLNGTNPKVVSERLGHSTILLTLNTYSHVTPTMQDEAARSLAPFLSLESRPIRLEQAG